MSYIELLRDLVAFDTVNDPAKGQKPTRDCPEYLQEQLKQLGLSTEIIEQNGFYSVLGKWGEGHPVTLLLAHFDVVPIGPGWTSDPFVLTIRDGLGFGRGTADDKGNVTALLLTAEKIVEQKRSGTVAFAMTGDEEIGGLNGAAVIRQYLEKQQLLPNYLITADGIGMQIITRRRNTCGITIGVPAKPIRSKGTVTKRQFTTEFFDRESRHAAYFAPGVDRHALLAASSFFRQNPQLEIMKVTGAFLKSNVVPDWVELHCLDTKQISKSSKEFVYDANLSQLIRTLLPLSRIHFNAHPSDYGITLCPNLLASTEDAWQVYFDGRAMTTDRKSEETAIRAVLTEHLRGIDYQVTVHMGRAFMNTPLDARLVKLAQTVAQQLHLAKKPIELAGASDTRHFTDRPVEAIDFGPMGYGIHGANEHVLLESLPLTAEFYTNIVFALHQPLES